jgi:hypothetical protein
MMNMEQGGRANLFLGVDGKTFEFDDLKNDVMIIESSSKTDSGLNELINWLNDRYPS